MEIIIYIFCLVIIIIIIILKYLFQVSFFYFKY